MKWILQISYIFIAFYIMGASHLKADGDDEKAAKILSYNVLADRTHLETRLPALFKILKDSHADIIALQEVAPWFIEELEKQPWTRSYHSLMSQGKRSAPRGLLVLSKSPITEAKADYLPSRQQRAYLIVETLIQGVKVSVANCHLDSPLESGVIRAKQLDVYFQLLKEAENAIFLGDFNFGDGERPETGKLRDSYVDSWKHTNQNEAGFTWDIEKSQMARLGSFPKEKSRRLDRILIRSKRFSPLKTEIVGDTEIQENRGVFPSDHFGLLSTMAAKQVVEPE